MGLTLTPEEKDLFSELKHLDVYKVIIKVLNQLAEDQGESVLKADIHQITDRDLVLLKAKYDAASKIVRDFHNLVSRTRPTDALK